MRKPWGKRIKLVVTNIPCIAGQTSTGYEDRYYDNSGRLVKVVRHKHIRSSLRKVI